jgi:hypothetical protein
LVQQLDAADPKSYPGSGTVWYDRSINKRNVTLINDVVYSSDFGGGFTFGGSNDYASSVWIDNSNNELTLEIAMKYDAKGAYHNIFDRFSSNPMLWIRPDNKLEVSKATGIVSPNTYIGQNIVVAAVYRSGVSPGLQLYVNGSLVSQNDAIQASWPNPSQYTLFNRSNNQSFSGSVYYLKFYSRALSPEEVLQNYNATKSRFGL